MFFSKCFFPRWKASLKNSHLSVSILRNPWRQTPSYLRMNWAEAEGPKTRMRRREKGRISAKQNKIYGLGTPKLRHYELIERASLYWIMQSANPKQALHRHKEKSKWHKQPTEPGVLPVEYEIPSTGRGIFLLLQLPAVVVVSQVSILTTMQSVSIHTIFLSLNHINNSNKHNQKNQRLKTVHLKFQ